MENKRQVSGNSIVIPDIIDPGITIPIFDDVPEESNDQLNSQQPQKIGSYRTRAGKFSNTLSNLLPSISARLHHAKKNSNGKNAGDVTPMEDTMESDLEYKMTNGMTINTDNEKLKKSRDGITIGISGPVSPQQESDKLVHFPSTTDYSLNPPRQSNDSFIFNTAFGQPMNRTRNNTISSQITSISSIAPGPVSAGAIWSNNNLTMNDPSLQQQQTYMKQMNTPTAPSVHEYQKSAYYDSLVSPPNNNLVADNISMNHKTGNMLNVPGNTIRLNPATTRPRSTSNASSVYTDAAQFDQQSTYSHTQSIYTNNHAYHETPLVMDDVNPGSINWVSNDPNVPSINQISNLLPTNTISISNVFPLQEQQPHLNNAINLTSTSLATLCSKFGEVVSARTFRGINMAIVEFTSAEAAVAALEALQGKEVSMIGSPSFVAFAKILPMHQQSQYYSQQTSNQPEPASQPLLQEQLYNGSVTLQQQGNVSIPVFNQYQQHVHSQPQNQYLQQSQSHNQQYGQTHISHNSQYHNNSIEREQCPFPLPPPSIKNRMSELETIINSFDIKNDDSQIKNLLVGVANFKGTADTSNFGPLPEPITSKEFEISKLRELRKAIDSDTMSEVELEQLAMCMLEELPELSSDYLGNTIVQKLFESSSDIIKDIMLRKTHKYLTSMGVHKNGTWACQKIITMAHTPRQLQLVTDGIKDYCTPLFNDQFGNYVIQCVLKFGFPWNNFIFESIIANFWTIVQNRYGARAVRACLEAHDIITKEQTLVLSSIIILYSEYLATNANSSLLLTWLLDTCVLHKRYTILASNITKHIVELCHHRLASLTILKILNLRGDDEARKITLQAIFGDLKSEEPPNSLKSILNDSSYGPTFIYKVLCMPLLEEDIRAHIIQQVRNVVKDSPSAQQHRRLMEEIGFTPTTSQVQNNQINQNKYIHRKTSSNIAFNPENAGHMRLPSTSSIRSSGSRKLNVVQPSQPPPPLPAQVMNTSLQAQVVNTPNSSVSDGSYSNYPGVSSGGFFGYYSNNNNNSLNNSNIDNDDIVNKLEKLNLINGTHLPLPQLSFRGRVNSNANNASNKAVDTGSLTDQ